SAAFSSDTAASWYELGLAYSRAGWQQAAEAALRRAADRGQAEAFSALADLLLEQGLPFAAMQALRGAGIRGQPRLRQLEAQYPAQQVSVYTPGYGCEAFLERCLRSIKAQTYPVHEILLVDDRSPDRSTEIALRHGVRVFYHEENRGLAASCNTALRHATGEFLAKIDSDLELEPTWLERAMLAGTDPHTGGVGGRMVEHYTVTLPDRWRRV